MNQAIKQQWTKALRSGQYRQGKENLYACGHFCCLGVLTDIYIQETGQQWHHDIGSFYSFEGEDGLLPLSVQKWAGLDAFNPYICGSHLAAWNDQRDLSFEELADLIEEHL